MECDFMTAIPIPPGSIPTTRSVGLFPSIKERLFGKQEATLKEDKVQVHWVSLLYMGLMSVFALKVFAMHDLQNAFDGSLDSGIRMQASMFVAAIIGAVGVSDYAAPKAREVARLAALRGEIGQAMMLRIYALTVYICDGYAVLASLLQNMNMGESIPGGFVIEIGIRVLLITFTGWMIHTVTQKQYPTEATLARKGAETTGGVLINRITERDAKDMSTGELATRFKAFLDAMHYHKEFKILGITFGKKPQSNDQWTQLEQVLTKESKTKEEEIANLIEAKEKALADQFTKQIEAQSLMITELTATIKDLIASGLSVKSNRKGQVNTGTNEVDSNANIETIYKQFFNELPKKGGKDSKGESIQLRGIWVTARQVAQMINNGLEEETIKDIVAKVGQRTKIQVAYAANIRGILSHSLIKPLLIEPWKTFISTDKGEEIAEEIPQETPEN
jgi:hypothetical protein